MQGISDLVIEFGTMGSVILPMAVGLSSSLLFHRRGLDRSCGTSAYIHAYKGESFLPR